jgi:hypothetical protein
VQGSRGILDVHSAMGRWTGRGFSYKSWLTLCAVHDGDGDGDMDMQYCSVQEG